MTHAMKLAGFPTPDEIRFSIQSLVAEDDLEQAAGAAEVGLSAYPESEGVLAISSLVAVVRQEWDRAVDLLERLIALQGGDASEFTRNMYERALTCSGRTPLPSRQDLA